MTAHEDRDWERMLEEVDLASSDEEMAAAEQRLRDLSDVDVVPVRKEWIEATVQRAIDSAKPVVPVKPTWWRKVQGFAAAAAALIGFQSVAAASFTVGTVVVVTTIVASKYWPEGVNSDQTLPYQRAVLALQDPEAPLEEKQASLAEVTFRISQCAGVLVQHHESASTASSVKAMIGVDLAKLGSALSGKPATPAGSLVGDIDSLIDAAKGGSTATLATLVDLALHGISALQGVTDPELTSRRDRHFTAIRLAHGL